MPQVSVIIPLYNQGHFLHDSVKSLREQTFADWQGVIVNDGSTDDSLSVAEIIVGDDKRFAIVTRPNGGLSAARNTGLEHCNGEYVALLDSDDYFLPNHLFDMVAILKNHDLSPMVAGRVQETNESLQPIKNCRLKRDYLEDQLSEKLLSASPLCRVAWNNPFAPCAQLWRASVIQRLKFDESLKSNEDWDLLWRALIECKQIQCYSQVVSYYRRHGSSLNKNNDQMLKTRIAVFKKNWPLLEPKSIEAKCAELGMIISLMTLPANSSLRSGLNLDMDYYLNEFEEILSNDQVAPFAILWCGGALRRGYPGRNHFQFPLWIELVKILIRNKRTYQITWQRLLERFRGIL